MTEWREERERESGSLDEKCGETKKAELKKAFPKGDQRENLFIHYICSRQRTNLRRSECDGNDLKTYFRPSPNGSGIEEPIWRKLSSIQ